MYFANEEFKSTWAEAYHECRAKKAELIRFNQFAVNNDDDALSDSDAI